MNNAALGDPYFAGTGFTPGSVLRQLLGGEWDGVQPGCSTRRADRLLPFPGRQQPRPGQHHALHGAERARVFDGSAEQFSWGLDNWGTEIPAADPRLQAFMRNVLDDLTRPAPPTELVAQLKTKRVGLDVGRHPDSRVRWIAIYRHRGSGDFAVHGPGAQLVCVTTGDHCADTTKPFPRVARYAAVTRDRWGVSPTYSKPVQDRAGVGRALPAGRRYSPAVGVRGTRGFGVAVATAVAVATFAGSGATATVTKLSATLAAAPGVSGIFLATMSGSSLSWQLRLHGLKGPVALRLRSSRTGPQIASLCASSKVTSHGTKVLPASAAVVRAGRAFLDVRPVGSATAKVRARIVVGAPALEITAPKDGDSITLPAEISYSVSSFDVGRAPLGHHRGLRDGRKAGPGRSRRPERDGDAAGRQVGLPVGRPGPDEFVLVTADGVPLPNPEAEVSVHQVTIVEQMSKRTIVTAAAAAAALLGLAAANGAVLMPTNVNVSKLVGNEDESAIAVDPVNISKLATMTISAPDPASSGPTARTVGRAGRPRRSEAPAATAR